MISIFLIIYWRLIRLEHIINFEKEKQNYPIPGKDAIWLAHCNICSDHTLHVSKNGFKNDGIDHCYSCGVEKQIKGFETKDIERMKTSSYCHWKNYMGYPYNWHKLNENEKQGILWKKPG